MSLEIQKIFSLLNIKKQKTKKKKKYEKKTPRLSFILAQNIAILIAYLIFI